MTRYFVAVKEDGKPQWASIVEATSAVEAAYQYPGYFTVFKKDYFMAQHGTPEEISANWGDVVFVEPVDKLIADFLGGGQDSAAD